MSGIRTAGGKRDRETRSNEPVLRLLRENTRLENGNRRLQRQINDLTAIGDVVRSITSSLKMEEILKGVLTGIRTALRLDKVVLGLISPAGEEEFKLSIGVDTQSLGRSWTVDRDSPVWARLCAHAAPVTVDPACKGTLPRALARAFPGPFLKAPLIVRDEILGSLMCYRSRPPLRGSDVRLLSTFAEYASIAIQNGRLYYDVLKSEEELRKAQRKLIDVEKMALIGQMAISVNHEINNPLCNISLIVQTVGEHLNGQPQAQRLLADLQENVERIRKVTRKISDLRQANLTEYLPNQMMVDLR